MIKVIKYLLGVLTILSFITGCTIKGENYITDTHLMNELNNYDLKKVAITPDKNSISSKFNYEIELRGATMTSPYGSYTEYIVKSLSQQLSQNNLYDPTSEIIINVSLIKNESDVWGFSEGNYNLIANFKILKNEKIIYDENIESQHSFPSHFLGQIAIENAIKNYPIAIQKLISKFLSDKRVIKLLAK